MLTKLALVNRILSFNGQFPVTALQSSDQSWVARAEEFLDDENRSMQDENRWSVSVRTNVELTPDANSHLIVPDGALVTHADAQDASLDIVQVGERLYDRANNTDEFDSSIRVRIAYLYAVHCIPEHLQSLAAARAAERLCVFRGDSQRYQSVQLEVRKAYIRACQVDGDVQHHSTANNELSRHMLGNRQPWETW